MNEDMEKGACGQIKLRNKAEGQNSIALLQEWSQRYFPGRCLW